MAPVFASMAIPGCNSGLVQGGNTGLREDLDGEITNHLFQGCENTSSLL